MRTTVRMKCVIWDLDNTLWQGVLPEGDDVRPFPEALDLVRRLEAAGIVQSIASRNDHGDAYTRLTALGLADIFVYPQISWSAKSASVAEIVRRLNIGADTVVLLDDSAFERAEVAATVDGVRCYSLPEFLVLDERAGIVPTETTADAARRPETYREESRRQAAEAVFEGTPQEFLATLDMRMLVRPATAEDLARGAELTERTNQLNTTGRTYSVEELAECALEPDCHVLIAELTDRFGDYGRIGLSLVRCRDDHWLIELMLMSCRVSGRNVGNAFIGAIAGLAGTRGTRLRARYRPNGRNRQMRITYALLGFAALTESDDEDGTLLLEHPRPGEIAIPRRVTVTMPIDHLE